MLATQDLSGGAKTHLNLDKEEEGGIFNLHTPPRWKGQEKTQALEAFRPAGLIPAATNRVWEARKHTCRVIRSLHAPCGTCAVHMYKRTPHVQAKRL